MKIITIAVAILLGGCGPLAQTADYATGGVNRGANGGFCYGCQGGYAPPPVAPPPNLLAPTGEVHCQRIGNIVHCHQ